MNRWLIYQKERFPLLQHTPLVAAFSSSAVLYSAILGKSGSALHWGQFLAAFVVCLLFFLQLRIADEFKDAGEDAQFRPERPVPCGLVKLRELGWIFAAGCLVQLIAAWWLHPRLLWLLFPSWAYLAGMSFEFGVRDWLKARPVTYMWTHMFIMPIVDFFATGCHWATASGFPPSGLAWFLAASFLNGLVLELGRKIRPVEAEQPGVPTYSKLWGIAGSCWAWWGSVVATMICGWVAMDKIELGWLATVPFALICLVTLFQAKSFTKRPQAATARRFEALSALVCLTLYLTLGIVSWFTHS